MTGSPAPTEDSWKTLAPEASAAAKMSCHSLYEPEKAFLLGVTMLMPLERKAGYWSATSWEEVLSTRTTFSGALARYSTTWGRAGGAREEAARVSRTFSGLMAE
jgi:hypothetical protein